MSAGFDQLNALAASWREPLWRACWQGGSVLLLVWLACRLFPRLPARARIWLWRLAYGKLLLAFLWTTPIDLPLLRASPAPDPALISVIESRTNPVFSQPFAHNKLPLQPPPRFPWRALPSPSSWLLMLWGLGVSWFGGRTLRDLHRARLLRRGCRLVTDERLQQCARELGQHFRLRHLPSLLVTDTVSSPLLLGIRRPVIVLPLSIATGSSLEHLRLMIAHEMAHIKRLDLWWVWLAVWGEALFFFHPAVWLAKREWRLTQEMACDEMVVRMTRIPTAHYGEMLVGVTSLVRPNCREPMLITLGGNETSETLKRRLHAMKFINAHSTKAVALATGAILAVSVITLVPWRLVAQETQEPSAAPTGPRSSAPTPPEGTGRYGLSAMGERGTSRMPMAAPRPPTDVAPARFEATVYEVEVPEGRISDLDARALEAKAATPQDLTKALGEFGKTRVMHKIDQTVNLYGENIMLGTSEPMVTGSRRMTSGEAVNTITYQQVGLIVSLSASAPPKESSRKGLDVQVNFNLSAFVDSGVELASGVKASSVRTVQLSQSGTPKFGKPSVLLNVSAAAGGDKVPPVAYVVRYSFSESKP